MKTTLFGCVLSALMLASCSSEQNVAHPTKSVAELNQNTNDI